MAVLRHKGRGCGCGGSARVGDGAGEVGPAVGSVRGLRLLELPIPLPPNRTLRVVAFLTRLPPYPSASSGAISLQSELLVPRSYRSLVLLMLPSFEWRLGVRAGAFRPRFSVLIRVGAAVGGTMVAPAKFGTVCMTKNLRVALASPAV